MTPRALYEMLEESQWWDGPKLLDWQRRQLGQLLTHARMTVPFYRFRLNKIFRADGRINWERWQELPVLTREDVMSNYGNLVSRAPLPVHGALTEVSSSGSTGHPVTVLTTQWLYQLSVAANSRAHRWAGLDWSRPLVAAMAPIEGKEPGASLGPWGPPWLSGAKKGRLLYTPYAFNPRDRLLLMKKERAPYLATTAMGAHVAADLAIQGGMDVPVEVVLTRGENTSDFVRERVATAFGARVVELYSSKECGTIAHPCPSGEGWHVNAESMLYEVLDDENRPVPPGTEGRVVLTPFGMTGFPLIRYDQGDRVVAGERCGCGRGLPHFKSISGRTRHFMRRPNGESIADLPIEARKALGAGRWQIAKTGPHDYEVRYETRDWGTPPDVGQFLAIFRSVFYSEANVVLKPGVTFTPGANGKFQERLVEWKPGEI